MPNFDIDPRAILFELAYRWFADHLEPDLVAKGIPPLVINWMRDGFVQGAVDSPEMVQRMEASYAA